ncbi:MAG TPA: PPC domain-containing DNA-binding protein [Candidatus Rubrimentiphilum sp.]|nr:PPC domain-containing DNA-binding protein [Candidatus Rubrimentiphilum sp.]
MEYRLFGGREVPRRFVLVFETGDDVMGELQRFVEEQSVMAAFFHGLGGVQRATVGFYNLANKQYEPIEIDSQSELLSLNGNVSILDGKQKLHIHVVLGRRDGSAVGGHLLQATVRPTLEIVLDELAGNLHRTDRPEVGIPLLDLTH